MRIAIFTEAYLPRINGVVTHIKLLKEGLEARGHQVLIVAADGDAKEHYIENGVLHCPGIKLSKKLSGFETSVPVSRKRLNFVRDFKPDIIHVETEFGMGLCGVSIAKMLKDADALDRVRVMDLDPRFLRYPCSEQYVDFAYELYRIYQKLENN